MIARIALCVLLILPAAAPAQVSARQGTPDPAEERTEFRSPMVVDLPLTVAGPALWGKGQVRSSDEVALRKYSCDGVSFVDFAGAATRQRNGSVKLVFTFTLHNEPSVDKLATVKLAVMSGEREVAVKTVEDLDAEEGKSVKGQVVLTLPEEELLAKPAPTLRMTVKVIYND